MNNFAFVQFILRGLCFLAIQQGIAANTNNCNTLNLGPEEPLVITIFDSEYKFGQDIWKKLCGAIKYFPDGLVTVDYKPGSLATGSKDDIKCGSGDCKNDLLQACFLLHSNYYNDCFRDTEDTSPLVLRCYCSQAANEYLLKNAALREAWNVPADAGPTLAMNKTYDPCVKFGSTEDILKYLCQVYKNRVGKC